MCNDEGIKGTVDGISLYIEKNSNCCSSISRCIALALVADSENATQIATSTRTDEAFIQEAYGWGGNRIPYVIKADKVGKALVSAIGLEFVLGDSFTKDGSMFKFFLQLLMKALSSLTKEKLNLALWCLSKRCYELTSMNKTITNEALSDKHCSCFEKIDRNKCGLFDNDKCTRSNSQLQDAISELVKIGLLVQSGSAYILCKY